MKSTVSLIIAACVMATSVPANAEPPWVLDNDTRYMALGDSLTAGKGAHPVFHGYAYQLYTQGVFDTVPNTQLVNVGVPAATSQDVLDYQVPLAVERYKPHVITITAGGNDLLGLFDPTMPPPPPEIIIPAIMAVIENFSINLTWILTQLCNAEFTETIIVGNVYVVPEILDALPGSLQAFEGLNQTIDGVVAFVGQSLACDVRVADVFTAFGGLESRDGLLLIDRPAAGPFEVHPTNAGYNAMTDAFAAAYKNP